MKQGTVVDVWTNEYSYHCLSFLSFLVLFLKSRFSVEYCFLVNRLLIAVLTASAAAKNIFSSNVKPPCNFSSSFIPPGIASSSTMDTLFAVELGSSLLKPLMTLTRAREECPKLCKLETPVTIHRYPVEQLVDKLVGMNVSSLIETTWNIKIITN